MGLLEVAHIKSQDDQYDRYQVLKANVIRGDDCGHVTRPL